ncbi:MAG: hypothetical protein WCA20_08435 [Candidatus Sulfotelmatobacter sp.]
MNSNRFLCAGSLARLIVIAGCAGGGYDANNVTVTVSPPAATVSADGQVTLQANVKGLCSTCASMIQQWSIAEDPSAGSNCTFYEPPPLGPCPAGSIQETAGGLSSSLTVIYFAPGTPGTYHITAEWSTLGGISLGGGSPVSKYGTSVIMVSP